MRNVLISLRPHFWLLSISPTLVGFYIAGGNMPLWHLILAVVAVCSISGFAEIVNDWTDRDIDVLQRLKKCGGITIAGGSGVIQSGGLTLYQVFAAVFVLLLIGVAIASILGTGVLIVTLIGFGMAAAYSLEPVRLKCRGWFGLLDMALFRGTVSLLVGYWAAQSSSLGWVIPAVILTSLFLGTSCIPHLLDYEDDKAIKVTTFPVVVGYEVAARMSATAIAISILIVSFVAVTHSVHVNLLAVPLVVVAALVFLALATARLNRPQTLLRIVPLTFVLALALPLVFLQI